MENTSNTHENGNNANTVLPAFISKFYKLSKDYRLLWKLIHDGHRVAGWVLKSTEYDAPIFDIVEIKISQYTKEYMIGTRGIGFEGFENTFADFRDSCVTFNLRFIVPDNCR